MWTGTAFSITWMPPKYEAWEMQLDSKQTLGKSSKLRRGT